MEKAWFFQSHNSKFYLFLISAFPWASWNRRLPFCSSEPGSLAGVHRVGQLWLRVSGPHLFVHCCTLSSQVHTQSGTSRIHFILLLSITPMLGACCFCIIDLQHENLQKNDSMLEIMFGACHQQVIVHQVRPSQTTITSYWEQLSDAGSPAAYL